MAKAIYNREGVKHSNLIPPSYYKVAVESSGYALIINNFKFTNEKSNLPGSEQDTLRLTETFEGLNFRVNAFENLTSIEMMKKIEEYARIDYTTSSMFVCILSSHGIDEKILGSDLDCVYLVKLMVKIINCPSLYGKPKLFFIDVCRDLTKEKLPQASHQTSDFFICYSTLQGQKAWTLSKEPWEGSVFLKSLCDIFRQYGEDLPLHELMQKLKSAVNSSNKQSIEIKDSLTKNLRFIPTRKYKWVLAFDFGTRLSGYAFSTFEDYSKNPLNIKYRQPWNSRRTHIHSAKTATAILFNKNLEFVSFGYDAFYKFADLQRQGTQDEYIFCQNFKMDLYKNVKSFKSLYITDTQGHSIKASTLFTESIRAIMSDFREKTSEDEIDVAKIRYVLTVPAIWSNAAKLFMKECALKAGIPWEKLLLALEPEAASIYCQFLEIEKADCISDGYKITHPGTKYMVVDIGGGTTDITVHEKTEVGIKEIRKAHGGDVGGCSVDDAFLELFCSLFGRDIMFYLEKTRPSTYVELLHDIEDVKKSCSPKSTERVEIRIPYAVNTLICEIHKESLFQYSRRWNADQFQLIEEKLSIDASTIRNLFKPTIDKIIDLLNQISESIDVSLIVLVGGFAECQFLLRQVKAQFPLKRVVVAEDAGMAVLKGAVLFGHKPDTINPRVTRSTYGVECLSAFDESIHDESRKVTDGWGEVCCSGTFSKIIERNKSVPIGEPVTHSYITSEPFQKAVNVKVFEANADSTLYTNDSNCHKIGQVQLPIVNPSNERRSIKVDFYFGDTEIKIKAKEEKCGETIEHFIDVS